MIFFLKISDFLQKGNKNISSKKIFCNKKIPLRNFFCYKKIFHDKKFPLIKNYKQYFILCHILSYEKIISENF